MNAIVSYIESDDNLELKDFSLDGFKPLDILEVIRCKRGRRFGYT